MAALAQTLHRSRGSTSQEMGRSSRLEWALQKKKRREEGNGKWAGWRIRLRKLLGYETLFLFFLIYSKIKSNLNDFYMNLNLITQLIQNKYAGGMKMQQTNIYSLN
jgi:hypothetical protein